MGFLDTFKGNPYKAELDRILGYTVVNKEVLKMSEREFNEIFSERLRYYLEKYEITQLELLNVLALVLLPYITGVMVLKLQEWIKSMPCARYFIVKDLI